MASITGTRPRTAGSSRAASETCPSIGEFTDEEAITDDVQDALSSFVNGLVGRELRVDYRWAGIFGLVLDFLPVVGEVPGMPGTWVAAGYSGHGNVLGFACGRLAARAILGDRDPLLDLFEPARLLGV